ncbi:MAG TPA: acyl-CoA synthetase [Acidimicrobiaceae bacterium]|nr:acyl-CoA synthetase [Acidimicrobiaceae bacterium]
MTVRQISGRHRTVVEVLRARAEVTPDLEAYVEVTEPAAAGVVPAGADGRRRLTFGQWDAAADGVAGLFADRGVTKGDVVCLVLPSSIDYAVCYQAAARLGAVTSGINSRLGQSERLSVLARLRPRLTVADPAPAEPRSLPPEAGDVLWRPELAAPPPPPPPSSSSSSSSSTAAPPLPSLDAMDPVCVVWTSGSTGVPKGAIFDHANPRAVADGTDVLSRPGDRRLSPLPFPHVGYMTRPWDEIAHGITTVVTPQPWSAGTAIALMAQERVTVGQGVPTQWALVLAHPDLDRADLSSLRIAGTGAARVPAELVRAMRARLGCAVVVRYTSTETSLGTATLPGDPVEVVCNTVGRPVPGVELSVVGEDGSALPRGEIGRVRLRSAATMRGYVGDGGGVDASLTASVLDAAGWVTTGDLGQIDPDGNLRLVGRVAELYIRGGYNVYPAEVEAVLRRHPAVADAAVVGVEDPVLGEVGSAFVVPSADGSGPTLDELQRWCRLELADYKAPDRLELVPSLPLTAMGKVDLRSLRTRAQAGCSPSRPSAP